jgi:predicted membrane protein
MIIIKILGALVVVVLIVLILFVIGCFSVGVYRSKKYEYKVVRVEGKVVKKEAISNEGIKTSKTTLPIGVFVEHNVYIEIDGKTIDFDDEELYRRVEVGDTVILDAHRGYDKKGRLRHEYHEVVK